MLSLTKQLLCSNAVVIASQALSVMMLSLMLRTFSVLLSFNALKRLLAAQEDTL